MPEATTDELLLDRAVSGDQAAFVQLYERHRNRIFRFAYRLVGSVETAEDVTHDCFLSLMRRPESFDSRRGSLRNYLYAAARNQVLKQFRMAGRESSMDELIEEPHVPMRDQPLPKVLRAELSRKVKEAILDLPPLQREALVLFEYEGLALSEIAAVLDTDIGAVKSRLYRARERLRKALGRYLNTNQEIVTLEQA